MSTFQLWLGETLLITTIFSLLFWLISPVVSKKPALQHLIWLIILIKFFTPPLLLGNASLAGLLAKKEVQSLNVDALSTSRTLIPASLELQSVASTEKGESRLKEPDSPSPEMARSTAESAVAARDVETPLAHDRADSPNGGAPLDPRDWYALLFSSFLVVWMMGTLCMAVYRICQLLQIHASLRVAEMAPSDLCREIEHLCAHWQIASIRAVVIAGIEAPFVWCFGSLKLVWPRSLIEQSLTPTCVLAHELAHLKRKDHWVAWLELAGDCIWWWNPVFWLVRRNLRQAAELACDHLAIALLPQERTTFAKFFLALAEKNNPAAAAFPLLGISSDKARFFERRIMMILSNDGPPKPGIGSWALAALAIGLLYPSWIFGDGRADRPQSPGQPNQPSLGSNPEGTAAPLDIRQTPLIEPKYQSKVPEYGLLTFGPRSQIRVWMVRDGETLYIDKNANGDLTEAGEKVSSQLRAPSPEFSLEQIPLTFQIDKLDLAEYPTRDLSIRFFEPKSVGGNQFGPRKQILDLLNNQSSRMICAIHCRANLPQVPSQLEDGMAFLMMGAFDSNGFLRFSSTRERAPVIKIGTSLGLDLQLLENDHLVLSQAILLSISVGFRGEGPGTFANLHPSKTIPETATPTIEVTLPTKEAGQFIKQNVQSLPNQMTAGHYGAIILPDPTQGPGMATLHLNLNRWEGVRVDPLTVTLAVTTTRQNLEKFQDLTEVKLPFKAFTYAKPRDNVDTLRFSRDGKRIMACAVHASQIIQVWDVSNQKQMAIFAASNTPVPFGGEKIEWNEDLTKAYLSNYKMIPPNREKPNERSPIGGTIRIVDLATGKDQKTLKVPDRFAPENLIIAPNGESFSTVEWEAYDAPQGQRPKRSSQTMLWNAQTGERRKLAPWNAPPHFSPDGKFLIGSIPDPKDQKGYIWALQNVATGEIVASLPSEKKEDLDYFVRGFSADGSKIFSAFSKSRSGPAIVRILDAKTLKTIHEFQPNISSPLYRVTEDLSRIAFINKDKKIEVWSTITGKLERTLGFQGLEKAGQPRLFSSPDNHYLAFSLNPRVDPDQRRAFMMGEGEVTDLPKSALILVDLTGVQPARSITIPPGPVGVIAFSPDSKSLGIGTYGAAYLFDLPR